LAKGILGIVLGLCLGWLWTAANAQEKSELWRQGQEVYIANCADCHRSNGEGLSDVFPALQKEPFVVGDPHPVIQLILEGKKAKVGHMPAWKNTLTDQQIAAVVTFIRQSWGNQAEAVSAEMVVKNRKR
jgi:mono/diheme cytochrome c family protein